MNERISKCSKAKSPTEAIIAACDDLTKALHSPSGVPLEDLQAAAEYLLDKIKTARGQGLRVVPPVKSRNKF